MYGLNYNLESFIINNLARIVSSAQIVYYLFWKFLNVPLQDGDTYTHLKLKTSVLCIIFDIRLN